ncbi:MAG: hypothetical protein EA384_02005 [Spirochaetaceae bacterium]|nr:MAG: hypothetical protein EA384_02005 [Spirochaetaceae bacterium]
MVPAAVWAAAAALLCILAPASCYWQPAVTAGSLRLSIEAQGQSELGTLQAEENAARIFLVAGRGYDQRFYPLNPKTGTPYLQTALSTRFPLRAGADVVIEGIPAIAPYRVFVATGEPVKGGGFKVSRWGRSDLFNITAGAETGADIVLRDSRPQVSWLVPAVPISGMVLQSETEPARLWAAAGSGTLYARQWQENELTGDVSGPVDPDIGERLIIHAIQPGRGVPLLVSTSNGLYRGGDLDRGPDDPEVFGRLDGTPRGTLGAVEFDGAGDNPVILYYRSDRIGGRDAAGQWFSIDMRQVVKGVPVAAMATTGEDYAFVATPAGAFRIAAVDLDSGWSTWKDLASKGTFFDAFVPSTISSLAVYDDGEGVVDLLVGTADGVYVFEEASSPEWNPRASGPTQIRVTRGRPIQAIATHAVPKMLAAIAPFELIVISAGESRSLPFVAAFPGQPTDLVWLDQDHLAVSGVEGLVVLDRTEIPLQ